MGSDIFTSKIGKNTLPIVFTIIGGLSLIIGIWATILYAQTEPYYKFNSEEYLNIVQKIEGVLEAYKAKIDSISLGSDSINQGQADAITNFINQPENSIFSISLNNEDQTSTYIFKYSDFNHYTKKYKALGEKFPLYQVASVSPSLLFTEQQMQLQRISDSIYKSVADIYESFHRIVPYSEKPIEPLTKNFISYVNKKTTYGEFALWFLIPGLILFSIGLTTWITRVRNEKREEKRLAAIKKFESSDKKEIRPAWVMAQETLKEYFDRNLFQIRLIFVVSVFIMIAGFLLIAVGVIIAYHNPTMSLMQNVSVASGLVTELIGATFIVIYNSTIRQAITYTDSLERINSVGMSVTILDSMKDSITDKDALNTAKIEVAKLLLTLDKKSGNTDTKT